MKFRQIIAAAAAASLIAATGCSDTAGEFKPTKEDKVPVMTVENGDGKETVQFQEFRYFFMNNKNDLYGADAVLDDEQVAKLKGLTEENIKKFHTVNLAAKKHGVTLSEEEKKTVESYTESFRADNGLDSDEYSLVLGQYFTTDYFFKRLYENSLLSSKLFESFQEQGVIKTDATAVDAALANDEILCAKEIYVGYSSEQTREVARLRANEAFRRLTQGEDFQSLMVEFSDYSTESLSPEHGYYTMEYDALDVVWNALCDLADGEHSVVLESEYGFHIVMRAEKDPEYIEENRKSITDSYANAKFSEYLYDYMDTLTLTYTEEGAALELSAMS